MAAEPFDSALVKRVANVLEWGVTTGPRAPDATFEKFAQMVLKVIDHEGWLREEAAAYFCVEHNDNSDMGRAYERFDSLDAMTEYIMALPRIPEGNQQHPAPDEYDLHAYEVFELTPYRRGTMGGPPKAAAL